MFRGDSLTEKTPEGNIRAIFPGTNPRKPASNRQNEYVCMPGTAADTANDAKRFSLEITPGNVL